MKNPSVWEKWLRGIELRPQNGGARTSQRPCALVIGIRGICAAQSSYSRSERACVTVIKATKAKGLASAI